ncbi:unnamed protein product [Ixodes persulcatus]
MESVCILMADTRWVHVLVRAFFAWRGWLQAKGCTVVTCSQLALQKKKKNAAYKTRETRWISWNHSYIWKHQLAKFTMSLCFFDDDA